MAMKSNLKWHFEKYRLKMSQKMPYKSAQKQKYEQNNKICNKKSWSSGKQSRS